MWILNFYGIICCWVLFFNFSFDLFSSLSIFLCFSRMPFHRSGLSWRTCSVSYANTDFFSPSKQKFCAYSCCYCCSLPLLETWFSVWRIHKYKEENMCQILFTVALICSFGILGKLHTAPNGTIKLHFLSCLSYKIGWRLKFHGAKDICSYIHRRVSQFIYYLYCAWNFYLFIFSLFRIVNIKWQTQSENAL